MRFKVALGVAFPILIILIFITLFHYYDERQSVEDAIVLSAHQITGIISSSLRHAMMENDKTMMAEIFTNVTADERVLGVQLINLAGEVKASAPDSLVGKRWNFSDPVCWECHKLPPESRPSVIRLHNSPGFIRLVAPIVNEPDCQACHEEKDKHLGILLMDETLADVEAHLSSEVTRDLLLSTGLAFLVALSAYLLIQRLVVQRVEAIRSPLSALSSGDYSVRIPGTRAETDELGALANAFNQMAGEIEQHEYEREQRTKVREHAIIEERERIARELHDGLSQLLGYINTKTSAVRILLEKRHIRSAENQLLQLEEAAQGLFLDVREAVLNLKLSSRIGENLATTLNECTQSFSRLSEIPIEVEIDPQVENLQLESETELHLLRIVQESLSNSRKHAAPGRIKINLNIEPDQLNLSICDDGVGFYNEESAAEVQKFGLESMRERANIIGADLKIKTDPGSGTCVLVNLPLPEKDSHASFSS